jgi:hypothetical protein
MEEAELRRQERALMRGIGICLFAFAAGMGLWVYNAQSGKFTQPHPAVSADPVLPSKLTAAPVTPPTLAVNQPAVRHATQPGPCYVHSASSDLRDKPEPSGNILKKESKGAKLILVALEDGGWAKVSDGAITGYMRASVLGADPPA